MSDGMFVSGFICFITAVLSYAFYRAWKTYTPRGFALYLTFWGCIVLGVVSAVNSTLPSSAPRRAVTGMISWITDHKEGKSHTYTVGFKTDDGADLRFTAAATPLFFAEGRDRVAIIYLDEKVASGAPRAIRFRALTGPRSGYETSVNADWFGPWLGVVLSVAIGIASIFGANGYKRLSPQQAFANPSSAL